MAETNERREADTVPTARTLGSVEAPSHGGALTRAASAALFDTAMGAGMGRPSPAGLIDLLARRPVEDRKAAIDDLNFRVGNRRVTRMITAGSTPIAHTGSGRQLLAHELSHVQQQQNGDRRLQRKEIDKALVASNRGGVANGDWLAVDREEWELASQGGLESMLSPTNTFMRAVYYNTQNLHPQEYQTVRERHDYYDLISYVLEFDKGTPKALQDVRFFHATTAVTGSPGIGTVDTPAGAVKLSQDTRQILREVNVELFALNMGIIQKLLFNWKAPRDPTGTSTDEIGSFQFDLRMVETEQRDVETYIRKNHKRFTPEVTGEINKSMDPDAFGQFFTFTRTSLEWAKKALKTNMLDFLNLKHRKAIGFANVHIFHRKSYSAFELFVAAYSVIP